MGDVCGSRRNHTFAGRRGRRLTIKPRRKHLVTSVRDVEDAVPTTIRCASAGTPSYKRFVVLRQNAVPYNEIVFLYRLYGRVSKRCLEASLFDTFIFMKFADFIRGISTPTNRHSELYHPILLRCAAVGYISQLDPNGQVHLS